MRQLTVSEFQSLALGKVTKYDTLKKGIPSYTLVVGVDTEYLPIPDQPTQLITTQLALSPSIDDCFVFEHPTLSKFYSTPLAVPGETFKSGFIGVDILGLPQAPKGCVVEATLVFNFLIYFAPADIFRGLFNDEVTSNRILANCTQDARLKVETGRLWQLSDKISTGYIVVHPEWGCTELFIQISDYSGVNGNSSLADTTKAFGIVREDDKDVFTLDEKKSMHTVYINRREEFLRYGKGDAAILFSIREQVENRFQNLAGVHSLNIEKNAPLTTGSTVNSIFQEYLKAYCGDFKTWTLYPNHAFKPSTFEELVEEGGIKRLVSYKKTSLPSSALVNGGRAKNEKPTTFSASGVIPDADISGAYSAQMKRLIYPLGVPTKYYTGSGSKHKYSLGTFLKKYRKDFVPGCWQIIVTGDLNFYQDLIASKVVDPYCIDLSESDQDEVNIDAPFRVYTKEIINGVITHDILQIIESTASNIERNGFFALDVVSAVYYPLSKKHTDPQTWYKAVEADKEKTGNCWVSNTNSQGSDSLVDLRSKQWLAVPLDSFIKPYQDFRKEAKDKLKKSVKGSEEYLKYSALQTSFKLVINTLYGVIATDKLPSGNAVCANNITAGIRAYAWLLKVSLGSFQSITDGGAYDANRVNFRGDNKPSFDTISKLRNPELLNRKQKSNICVAPLGGCPWTLEKGCDENWTVVRNETTSWTFKQGSLPELDNLALEHVKLFFRGYDIDLLTSHKIEHKYVFKGISTHSQTDYAFRDVWDNLYHKSRGNKVKGTPYKGGQVSNKVVLLNQLLDGEKVFKTEPQLIDTVLKVNQTNRFKTSKTSNVVTENGLTAGDTIWKKVTVSVFSLSQFFYQTDSQYSGWSKGVETLKTESGQGLEQFFTKPDGSVDYQRLVNTVQSRLDAGESWKQTGYWRF